MGDYLPTLCPTHSQEVPEISITLTPRCCSFSCLFFDLCGPALGCAGEHLRVVWQFYCYFLTRVCGVTTMCCVGIMEEAKQNAPNGPPSLPGSFMCPFQVSMQLLTLPESLSSLQLPRWVPVALNLLLAWESPEELTAIVTVIALVALWGHLTGDLPSLQNCKCPMPFG